MLLPFRKPYQRRHRRIWWNKFQSVHRCSWFHGRHLRHTLTHRWEGGENTIKSRRITRNKAIRIQCIFLYVVILGRSCETCSLRQLCIKHKFRYSNVWVFRFLSLLLGYRCCCSLLFLLLLMIAVLPFFYSFPSEIWYFYLALFSRTISR